MIPPLRIALSGGGMKGLAHVGALETLEQKGLLRCVKEYIGISAGALMGFCVVIGYSLSELRTLCTLFDFNAMQNLDPDTIVEFPERFGFDNGENMVKLLDALLKVKGLPSTLTFEEFANRFPDRPGLRVYAVDIHACCSREFSLQATPRAPLVHALRASMSIPFFFTPVKDFETGHYLVDGGLIAHFPFHHLSERERSECLGIAFTDSHRAVKEPIEETELKRMGLSGYILKLYYSAYYPQNMDLYSKWSHRIILIECGQFPSVHFDASFDQKLRLLELGAEAVDVFLERAARVNPRLTARRYSVS